MYFTNNAIAPYKGKKRLDRRSRRHNDGIKDIGIQIKQKARELAGYFKQLPNSKKVVFVLSQIGKIVGILLAKSAKGEALTAEDKILRDKLRKRIEDLKTFSEMRGFDASETINKKQEQLNPIESKDTRFKIKLFISLVSTFVSLIGDWFVLRAPKAEQLARRDNAILLRDESIKDKLLAKAKNLLQTVKRMPGMEKVKFALASLIALLAGRGALRSTAGLISATKNINNLLQEASSEYRIDPNSATSRVGAGIGLALGGIVALVKAYISVLATNKAAQIYARNNSNNSEQLARRDNAIKRFGDISRDNARRVLFAIVTAAAGFALSKLISKIRDPKHANEIRSGRLKESDYVKDFADNFLKKSSIIVPMNDPEAAEYINESLNIVRNARTIDELLSVFPGNRELMNAKRLYSELKMTRDSTLKRRIDKSVRKYVSMALR
jgi:hypothetical protein